MKWPRLRTCIRFPVLCALLLAAQAMAAEPQNVLVLYSNGRLVPGNVDVERGLHSSLQTSVARPVHVFTEFLDSPDFHGDGYERTLTAYLRDKYASHPPDVILAVAKDALEFVVRHRATLFPRAAVVHAAVFLAFPGPQVPLPAGVVGVLVDYDIAGTLAQAFRWHPKARRLVVVTGAAPRDREWEARLRAVTGDLGDRIELEFLADWPTERLAQRLGALDERSIVYTPGFYQSGDGLKFTPRDAVQFIAAASSAPVYGPFSTFIGTGAVGGRVPSFETAGRSAGHTINALLRGERPESLSLPRIMPNELNVDWRQAQRWGIDDQAIPADSLVQFRQPSFWQAYRTATVIAATVVLLQAGLIASLLLEHRRRRKVESALIERGSELAHALRLAIAGELTASIAHEINQPLAAILANAETAELLLQSGRGAADEMRSILTDIRRDDRRASDVIARLRTLLATHATSRQPFELNAVVGEGCELLMSEARRRKVALVVKKSATTVDVTGDAIQIQQVLINLLLNAMDAIGDLPERRRAIHVCVSVRARNCAFTVSDRGRGIAPEDLPRLFDSFYSTKQRGMGLGLSITRTIVEAHGGRTWAESTPGSGAVFHVELPRSAEAHTASQPQELT
jgi:signal transduction histidine kinase